MNEIITLNPLSMMSQIKFKDANLMNATKSIVSIYQDAAKYADSKNREIASVLSKVKVNKWYEADGFKSVAEYAEKTFGIKKQNAYSLASAGDIYNDAKASPALKALSPSKLSEVSKVPMSTIEEAIKSGKISSSTTQKDLRDFAAANAPKKDKNLVVDLYTARLVSTYTPDDMGKEFSSPRSMDEWDEYFTDYIEALSPSRKPEAIKLPKAAPYTDPLSDKRTVQRRVYVTEKHAFVIEFYTYKPASPAKPTQSPKFTIEQLKEMLAAAEEAEAADK